jgi:hypothetical protein
VQEQISIPLCKKVPKYSTHQQSDTSVSSVEENWVRKAFSKRQSRSYRLINGSIMLAKNIPGGASQLVGSGYVVYRNYHLRRKGHSKDVRHGDIRIAYAGKNCWPRKTEELLRKTFEKNFADDVAMRQDYETLMGDSSSHGMPCRLTVQTIPGKKCPHIEFPEISTNESGRKHVPSLQIRLFTNQKLMYAPWRKPLDPGDPLVNPPSGEPLTLQEKQDWKAAFKLAAEIKRRGGILPHNEWLEQNGISQRRTERFSSDRKRLIEEKRGKPFISERFCVSSVRKDQPNTYLFYDSLSLGDEQNGRSVNAILPIRPENKLGVQILQPSDGNGLYLEVQKLDEQGNAISEKIRGIFSLDSPLADAMTVANVNPETPRRQQMYLTFRAHDGGLSLEKAQYLKKTAEQRSNDQLHSYKQSHEDQLQPGPWYPDMPKQDNALSSSGWARYDETIDAKVEQNPKLRSFLHDLRRDFTAEKDDKTGKPTFKNSDGRKSFQECADGEVIDVLNPNDDKSIEGALKLAALKSDDNTISLRGSKGFINKAIRLAAKNEIYLDDRALSPLMQEKYQLMRKQYQLMKDPNNNRSQVNAQSGSLTKPEAGAASRSNRPSSSNLLSVIKKADFSLSSSRNNNVRSQEQSFAKNR